MAAPHKVPEHRRKWDTAEYEEIARKRHAEDLEGSDSDDDIPKKRELLRQREYRVDLDSRLGKSTVITKNSPASQSAGYYCNVCVCVVKDSINFLDHINGKKHQRNLGMSMKVERSSVDQVKQRFEINKKKKAEEKKNYDFEQRVVELQEEEEKSREYRREKRAERKEKERAEAAASMTVFDADDDVAAMMGFSGFGSSKKSNNADGHLHQS